MFTKNFKLAFSAILLFLSILFFYSCQKVFDGEVPKNPIPGNLTSTSVEGRVTDDTGLPVFGASVKAGLNNTTTDRNGMFKIINATFTANENFVIVSKSGFFQGSRTFFARVNSNNFLSIKLMKRTVTGRFQASSGGDIEFRNGGSSVFFEPNSIVRANGTSYNGTVVVATQYLNPTDADINERMPGDLRGVSTTGSTVGLRSFGMVAVELTDEAGQKLQIRNGMKASLSVAIPSSLSSTSPATIPLWYFNDTTGLWKQEGFAIKNGDKYEGDVSHFTFWNCDDPYEYVKIKARIVNAAGAPVASIKVQINSNDSSRAYDYTDVNGYVDGYVPKDRPLVLQVINSCGQVAFSSNIGPFASQTDLGNVTISQSTTTISGTAVNCTNNPVQNGYVQISINGSTQFAGIINGVFNYTFLNCGNNTTAQLIAVDNGANVQGNPINITITSNNINAGVLAACGVSANTFFNLTVAGTLMSLNTPNFERNGWKDTLGQNLADFFYAAYDSSTEKVLALIFSEISANTTFTAPTMYGDQNTLIVYAGFSNNSSDVSLNFVNPTTQKINFTEYGSVGQFIAGNFNGQLIRERSDSLGMNTIIDTVNTSMNFRVRHILNPF